MKPDREPSAAERLFRQAIELNHEEREALLQAHSAADTTDPETVQEVRALLCSHEGAQESFLEPKISAWAAAIGDDLNGGRPATTDDSGRHVGAFHLIEKLGEGGMGCVYRAEQYEPIHREVAVKLIRLGMSSKEVLARFEQERQALALMSHPGIAKVFDAGVTEDGSPFFAMELVPGIPVTRFCDERKLGIDARLELFLRIADAVSHAHQKGVIHRDLKPDNILCFDQDGSPQAKIIDFGIAKATNLRLTEKSLCTRAGLAIGTPEYMSPEQATRSDLDIDTRSDVYTLGVVLFELLIGSTPLGPSVDKRSGYLEVLNHIASVPAPRLSTRARELGANLTKVAETRRMEPAALKRRARGELEWILDRALQQNRDSRYSTVVELCADIRNYLQNLPVSVGPPTTLYRISRFVRRNRGAVALALTVTVALLSGIVVTSLSLRAATRAQKEAANRAEQLGRLSDGRLIQRLLDDADELWPITVDLGPVLTDWLDRQAAPLIDRLPVHRESLERLRESALPVDGAEMRALRERRARELRIDEMKSNIEKTTQTIEDLEPRQALAKNPGRIVGYEPDNVWRRKQLQRLKARLVNLETEVASQQIWRFESEVDQWWHDTLADLIADLELLSGTEDAPGVQSEVEGRLLMVDRLRESLTDPQWLTAWEEAARAIREDPRYGGLQIPPQVGLVPIGPDPQSKLWEFADLLSGLHSGRDPSTGRMDVTEESALVFVLIPGGTFRMGTKPPPNWDIRDYDHTREFPDQSVTLDPFFLSKFEITQAQWTRMFGLNPSRYHPDNPWPTQASSMLHPAESMSWEEAKSALARFGWNLPTESQWEYAARAGSAARWWFGESVAGLDDRGNFGDSTLFHSFQQQDSRYDVGVYDGYVLHAPIGRYQPNPFGFHDMIGNVAELCEDEILTYTNATIDGRGSRGGSGKTDRTVRGGSYRSFAEESRAAARKAVDQEHGASPMVGVRPAREIQFEESLPSSTVPHRVRSSR